MSPQRRNEQTVQSRPEPMAWRGAYDANSNLQYEGWAEPGAAEGSAIWLVAKHTYDASNNLTKSEWAQTSPSPPAMFDQIWTNYASLTYV